MPSANEVLSAFAVPSKVRLLEIGRVFGDLTVTGHAMPVRRANGRLAAMTACRCICGSEREYKSNALLTGSFKGCGCTAIEKTAAGITTHGHAVGGRRTSALNTHRQMIARCHNPSNVGWPNYGGRGIAVCDRWRDSFKAFLEDMGERPSPLHSLDRIDNDGDYEPGNVRWATPVEQRNNQRPSAKSFEWKGETISRHEAARRLGVSITTVSDRFKRGWSVERIMTDPLGI